MILAIDVHYTEQGSATAGVAFEAWDAPAATATYVSTQSTVVEYTPGKFYERELPCIEHLLREHALAPQLIVVDGYVFLDGVARPGLGKYLFDALGGKVPVVGIAKTSFAGIGPAFEVIRGASAKPLYVTCVGADLDAVKEQVRQMHGSHRIPTLLKAADQLCRAAANPPA